MPKPPRWTPAQFERDLNLSRERFRKSRLAEPVDAYYEAFDEYWRTMSDLLEETVDLTKKDPKVISGILQKDEFFHAFRYLPGPPISEDDLETLVDCTINARQLKKDPALASLVAQTIMGCLDQRRFPWVGDAREATESERIAATVASAALMAYQRVQTSRRHTEKEAQEGQVREALLGIGFKEVDRRAVRVTSDAPNASEFCGESKLGNRKADFIVGGLDGRILAIECKVSNSSINSLKRLNNDAAAKAEEWVKSFGDANIVPIAVLSGVYRLANLENAQYRGLTLFWAHSLASLTDWIKSCGNPKPARRRRS